MRLRKCKLLSCCRLYIATQLYTAYNHCVNLLKTFLFRHYFDHMASDQNMQFIRNPLFISAYSHSVKAVGQDLNIKMRVHQAIWACEHGLKLENGAFVELGTGKGFVFISILSYLSAKYGIKSIPNVYLFDTFLPTIPDPISGSQDHYLPHRKTRSGHAYASSFLDTKENFNHWPSVHLIQGKLPQSIFDHLERIGEISFLHIDLNYHVAEIETLSYLWGNMKHGSIIILDDYANHSRGLQMRAHDEFFKKKNHSILTTASGQGIVIVSH